MRIISRREFNEACLDDCLIARALSGLCVGLALTDAEGRVIWLNRAAAEVLGEPPDECIGQVLDRLLKDLQLSAFWQEAAQVEGNLITDLVVQWPEKLALKANATRYTDSDGKVVGRALLFCDVTSERSVNVELSREVAERLLALTAGHMPPDPVAHLTHQEVRILRLVGQGLGNDEIAERAHISPSTVRSHLKNMYRKLGFNSRAEAVSYAARNNLV